MQRGGIAAPRPSTVPRTMTMHKRFAIDPSVSQLRPLLEVVTVAQRRFNELLMQVARDGGLVPEHYRRYLVFQRHLTRDVQRSFLSAAAHPSLSGRRSLREFLFDFALEEEPHSDIARDDLAALGFDDGESPFDVRLWWAYHREVTPVRPFLRLGAACVLENLGAGGSDAARTLLAAADFITPRNSRFIQIHFHEALPHGDQILHALDAVPLAPHELADLVQGAAEGAVMYLRMASWALGRDQVQEALERSTQAGGTS
jgi:hypothetical protein